MKDPKWITTNQIVEVYTSYKQGISGYQIAKKTGLAQGSIYRICRIVKKYLSNEYEGKKYQAYTDAVKIIKDSYSPPSMLEETKPVNGIQTHSEDHLTKFERAFGLFQEAIIEVIEAEAQRRSDEKVKELKEKYEKELLHAQELLIAAKDSNMVGFLRKKWLNK